MQFLDTQFFLGMIIYAPAILLALSFHELSHALVARRLGDTTAEEAGRITLNPLAHLDPVGTIMIFLFHFGWAKPVPVNPHNFRHPEKDMMLVSLAGPASNFALAVVFGMAAWGMGKFFGSTVGTVVYKMVLAGITINAILMVFNLIPIPPLDGSKILFGLIGASREFQIRYSQVGPILLLGLIVLGRLTGFSVFSMILSPVVNLFYRIFVYV